VVSRARRGGIPQNGDGNRRCQARCRPGATIVKVRWVPPPPSLFFCATSIRPSDLDSDMASPSCRRRPARLRRDRRDSLARLPAEPHRYEANPKQLRRRCSHPQSDVPDLARTQPRMRTFTFGFRGELATSATSITVSRRRADNAEPTASPSTSGSSPAPAFRVAPRSNAGSRIASSRFFTASNMKMMSPTPYRLRNAGNAADFAETSAVPTPGVYPHSSARCSRKTNSPPARM